MNNSSNVKIKTTTKINEIIKTSSVNLEKSMGHIPTDYSYKSAVDFDSKKRTLDYITSQVGCNVLIQDKMLEIGSGLGAFVLVCNKSGFNCFGVEPYLYSYKGLFKAREALFKLNGVQPSKNLSAVGEYLPFVDDSFSLVTSFNVLEHVTDYQMVLTESIRILKKGGVLYFRCPNYFSFYEGHFGIFWLPFLAYSKVLAKIWVKLWGKNPEFIDELNFITVRKLKNAFANLPVEIIQIYDPLPSWQKRLSVLYSNKSRASRFLQLLWYLSSLLGVNLLIRKFHLHYSISLMLKKK